MTCSHLAFAQSVMRALQRRGSPCACARTPASRTRDPALLCIRRVSIVFCVRSAYGATNECSGCEHCDLFFYTHCPHLCVKVCEACCLTVAAFADRSPAAAAAVPRALKVAESLFRTGVASAAELWSALTAVGIPSGSIPRPSAFCLHGVAYALMLLRSAQSPNLG